jgi:hypothetical protein
MFETWPTTRSPRTRIIAIVLMVLLALSLVVLISAWSPDPAVTSPVHGPALFG